MENMNNQDVQRVVTTYNFTATRKEVRKFGFDIGYGIAQGVFAAAFVTHLSIGFIKAVKKRMEKKIGVSVEVKPDEDDVGNVEETAAE